MGIVTAVRSRPGQRRVVVPVAGPLFRRAAALRVEDEVARRTLLLLAAYRDADPTRGPGVRELGRRLGGLPAVEVDRALDELVRQGLLAVTWARRGRPGQRAATGRRNEYRLRLGGGEMRR